MSVGSVTAEIARRICDEQNVGYSQGEDRRSWFAAADAHGRVSSPQSADCSSLAAGAVSYGLHHTYGVPWGQLQFLRELHFIEACTPCSCPSWSPPSQFLWELHFIEVGGD